MDKGREPNSPIRISLLIPQDLGGGLERVMLNLGKVWLAHGFEVDLLLLKTKDSPISNWPDAMRIIPLNAKALPEQAWNLFKGLYLVTLGNPSMLSSLIRLILSTRKLPGSIRQLDALTAYLQESRPSVLLSGTPNCNLIACWAKQYLQQYFPSMPTKIVISEHSALTKLVESHSLHSRAPMFWQSLPALMGKVYPLADAIISSSRGVADDLARTAGIERDHIVMIYNPVIDDDLSGLTRQPVSHPWFASNKIPIILSAGRLYPQKGFTTLLRAFAQLRYKRKARLIIVGEGRQRNELEQLACTLGIENDVSLPGWVENPFAYMGRASVFVLSSRYEGFGNVVAEALACGCPVVSTDCPYGPAEILEHGRYGRLVPVGEHEKMAEAIESILAAPPDRKLLKQRGMQFSVEKASEQYLALFRRIGAFNDSAETTKCNLV